MSTTKTTVSKAVKCHLLDGEENDVVMTYSGVKDDVTIAEAKTLANELVNIGDIFEEYPVSAVSVDVITTQVTTESEEVEAGA